MAIAEVQRWSRVLPPHLRAKKRSFTNVKDLKNIPYWN